MIQVGERLRADHQKLDGMLRALAQATVAPEWDAIEASWDALEARLLCHMQAEERYLLPLLEASHPAEVKRISTEHAQLRGRVAELGIAVELHLARPEEILTLVDALRRHTAYEDEALYRLAGDRASAAVGHDLLAALKTEWFNGGAAHGATATSGGGVGT